MQGVGKVNRRDIGLGLCLACRAGITADASTSYKKTLPGLPESLTRAPQQHDSWFISGKGKQKLEGPANSDGRYCAIMFLWGNWGRPDFPGQKSLSTAYYSHFFPNGQLWKAPLPDPDCLQSAPFSPKKDSFLAFFDFLSFNLDLPAASLTSKMSTFCGILVLPVRGYSATQENISFPSGALCALTLWKPRREEACVLPLVSHSVLDKGNG